MVGSPQSFRVFFVYIIYSNNIITFELNEIQIDITIKIIWIKFFLSKESKNDQRKTIEARPRYFIYLFIIILQ